MFKSFRVFFKKSPYTPKNITIEKNDYLSNGIKYRTEKYEIFIVIIPFFVLI